MPRSVVCVGILVADVLARPVDDIPWGSLSLVDEVALRGGGCALNTASALARLGRAASVAGKVGADALGDFLLGLMDDRGVDRSGVVRDPSVPTAASVALVSTGGERTFLHLPGANGRLRLDEIDLGDFPGAACVHVAGALVLEELDGAPTAELLADARRRGLMTSLDTVWDASGRWQRVEAALAHLDVAMPSLAEAREITGLADPPDVADWLRSRGVGTVALTMGADGCYVAGEGFEGFVPAPEVRAVDGTGAGDAFAAGFLHAWLDRRPLEETARFACAAGALAATAMGAYDGVGDERETLALANHRTERTTS